MTEAPDSAFERLKLRKRDTLIEIYKYLDAVPVQSPLPLKLLQQLAVMIQAFAQSSTINAAVNCILTAAAVQHHASAASNTA
jgi:hypothetical protein